MGDEETWKLESQHPNARTTTTNSGLSCPLPSSSHVSPPPCFFGQMLLTKRHTLTCSAPAFEPLPPAQGGA